MFFRTQQSSTQHEHGAHLGVARTERTLDQGEIVDLHGRLRIGLRDHATDQCADVVGAAKAEEVREWNAVVLRELDDGISVHQHRSDHPPLVIAMQERIGDVGRCHEIGFASERCGAAVELIRDTSRGMRLAGMDDIAAMPPAVADRVRGLTGVADKQRIGP